MGKRTRQRGGSSKKIGRDLAKCQLYRNQHRREKNKIKKLNKHIKKHINDKLAIKAIARYEQLLKG